MSEWMCDLCFHNAKEIGMIAPGYALILQNDEYKILAGQGHSDDDIYTFSKKPFVDPDPECLHDKDEIGLAEDIWLDLMDEVEKTFKLTPRDGHHFVLACTPEYGHKESFNGWLINKCGILIGLYEKDNKPG